MFLRKWFRDWQVNCQSPEICLNVCTTLGSSLKLCCSNSGALLVFFVLFIHVKFAVTRFLSWVRNKSCFCFSLMFLQLHDFAISVGKKSHSLPVLFFFFINVCLFFSPSAFMSAVWEWVYGWQSSGLCSQFPALSLPGSTQTQHPCPLFFYCLFSLIWIHLSFLLLLSQASRDQQKAEKCEWNNISYVSFSESLIVVGLSFGNYFKFKT